MKEEDYDEDDSRENNGDRKRFHISDLFMLLSVICLFIFLAVYGYKLKAADVKIPGSVEEEKNLTSVMAYAITSAKDGIYPWNYKDIMAKKVEQYAAIYGDVVVTGDYETEEEDTADNEGTSGVNIFDPTYNEPSIEDETIADTESGNPDNPDIADQTTEGESEEGDPV